MVAFIGEMALPEKPAEVIRAAFTLFQVLIFKGLRAFSDPYGPPWIDASFALDLVYQARGGSVRDLVAEYYTGRDVHEQARALMWRKALAQSVEWLQLCGRELPADLWEGLSCLIEARYGEKGVLDRTIFLGTHCPKFGQVYEMFDKGVITRDELNVKVCVILQEEFLNGLLKKYAEGWVLLGNGMQMSVERPEFSGNAGGFDVVHCYQVAGYNGFLGYCIMPLLGGERDTAIQPGTCYLRTERIWQSADIKAFCPDGDRWITAFKRELGDDPETCADLFREWLEQLIYWHEFGHLLSERELAQMREEMGEEIFELFQDPMIELYAAVHVLEKVEERRDPLLSRFLFTQMVEMTESLSFSQEPEFYDPHVGDVFVLRALYENNPSVFLRQQMAQIAERCAALGKRGPFTDWLGERIQRARTEVMALAESQHDLRHACASLMMGSDGGHGTGRIPTPGVGR